MERMTFYIPPVFLFGNNANRFHNNEEEKSEYKTAAETEIKVENWRAKRIAELEEENKKLRDYVDNLDSENDNQAIEIEELKKENKILKEKQKILDKENCELIDENVKLKKELKEKNELLSNVARCSEQYRGKMISVMEELKMFLYKD